MDKQKKQNIYLIGAVAALAGLLFGFDTGVISGAILFINHDFGLTHFQTELVVSSVLLGALIGAASSGRLCDSWGRKKIIITTAIIFVLGSLICAGSHNMLSLLTGRFALGVAIGIASFSAPLYLAELAPQNNRGFIVSLNQLAITLGILFSYLIDYYFSHTANWRMMLFAGVIPALLLLFGMFFLPESPRFLLRKGKSDEARKILNRIRVSHEVEPEINAVLSTDTSPIPFKAIFSNPHLFRILGVGLTIAVMQQVTGINTIIYYAPTIFKLAGFQTTSAILVTTAVGVVNVLFTIIVLPLVDKLGRRRLLFIGLSGMIASLMMLGYAFHQSILSEAMRYLSLLSMMLYIASFAISLGPVTFVLLSEIFPLNIRGQGMSLALTCNWTANMIVALTFLTFIHQFGAANTFYFYAAMSLFGLGFVYHFIPETKGVSLEHIENRLFRGIPTRQLGALQTDNSPSTEGAFHAIKE
jgi:sugar porter (SP) family MFS transporter